MKRNIIRTMLHAPKIQKFILEYHTIKNSKEIFTSLLPPSVKKLPKYFYDKL